MRYLYGSLLAALFLSVPVQAQISLDVPAMVVAGGDVEFTWSGTDGPQDFITLVKKGTPEKGYDHYVYAARGHTQTLRAPDVAGEYEVRYLKGQGYETLARQPLIVTPASATLQPPGSVEAGVTFEIPWSGPDNRGDFITLVEAGAPERTYNHYVYTNRGTPAVLRAPDVAGTYEVRYATGQQYTTLARHTITVVATSASLTAADRVTGGAPFPVTWEGPGNRGDFITIVEAGAPEKTYLDYTYTDRGNPVQVIAPLEPGDYELRYSTGQQHLTLAHRPIRVGPPDTQPGFLRVVVAGSAEAPLEAGHAVELILDASGSMLQRQGSQRRIDIAKEVITSLTRDVLPAGVPFFRVFGHKETGSCRTDLEVPLQALDAAQTASLIAGIEAQNLAKTPLAQSLALVQQDLAGATGESLVILITDGEETCGGDPAQAIEALKAAGIDVRVNIVGFAIDDEDLKQTFRYWASVGEGTYFDAANADELSASLTRALQVPFEVLNGDGETVAEGLTGGDPVALPAGTYRVRTKGNPPRILEAIEVTAEETKTVSLEH